MPDLLYTTSANVATLTLNRPDRLNAISSEMLHGIADRLWEAERDPDVRVIVVTGAGRGFCSGLDLKDVAGGGSGLGAGGSMQSARETGLAPPLALRRIDTPTICALNGPAAGYGMDLALGCDIRIASDQAKFASPVARGVVPESGGTWLLPRLVGWARACEIALLARPLGPEEMLELGLVNRVVAHDDLADTVDSWAAELAGNAPLAVQSAKRMMRLGLDEAFEANTQHVLLELKELMASEDFREGVAAFVEKRKPKYQGR